MTASPAAASSSGAGGVEDGLADSRAGRRAHAGGDPGDVGTGVERGEHQPDQLGPGDPGERLVHVDEALVDQLGRDAERRRGRPLADPCLQHPELAALDRELDVAQVTVVALQGGHDRHQLVVGRLVHPLQVLQRDGVADAGHDVLALRVLQVVTVDAARAGRRVPGEPDPGAGVVAEVAEDHRDHVHGRAEVGGDALLPPVQHGPVGVPRVEDGPDRQVQLLARVLREVAARLLAHDLLVGVRQVPQVLGVQVGVRRRAAGLLRAVERVLEPLAVDPEDRLAEHLDQPPVGVPGPPFAPQLVAGLLGQPPHRVVGQADVEDGVHHAGHREL